MLALNDDLASVMQAGRWKTTVMPHTLSTRAEIFGIDGQTWVGAWVRMPSNKGDRAWPWVNPMVERAPEGSDNVRPTAVN
jgi:hypothetical protein